PRTKSRNRQPPLARFGARDLADPSRPARICGRVGSSCRTRPTAAEQRSNACLTIWLSPGATQSTLDSRASQAVLTQRPIFVFWLLRWATVVRWLDLIPRTKLRIAASIVDLSCLSP